MKLYEINKAILNCIDDETGEIVDAEKLNELQLARDEKVESIACWIKNLTAEAEALKKEKQAFADRQSRTEKLIDSLKEYLSEALDGQKFNTARVQVSFRKSEQVSVEDVYKLPEDYITYLEPKPDKAGLKKLLKSGVKVEGCTLIEKNNIQVK